MPIDATLLYPGSCGSANQSGVITSSTVAGVINRIEILPDEPIASSSCVSVQLTSLAFGTEIVTESRSTVRE